MESVFFAQNSELYKLLHMLVWHISLKLSVVGIYSKCIWACLMIQHCSKCTNIFTVLLVKLVWSSLAPPATHVIHLFTCLLTLPITCTYTRRNPQCKSLFHFCQYISAREVRQRSWASSLKFRICKSTYHLIS